MRFADSRHCTVLVHLKCSASLEQLQCDSGEWRTARSWRRHRAGTRLLFSAHDPTKITDRAGDLADDRDSLATETTRMTRARSFQRRVQATDSSRYAPRSSVTVVTGLCTMPVLPNLCRRALLDTREYANTTERPAFLFLVSFSIFIIIQDLRFPQR
jgi:hypothetical protein